MKNGLDNLRTFQSVLSNYPDFTINSNLTTSSQVILTYKESLNLSVFLWDDYEFNNRMPIFTFRNFNIDYPHIMLDNITILGVKYRMICLFQNNYYIFSSLSLVDKIKFSLDSFVTLISLSKKRIEVEYQKEFLYYWNSNVKEFRAVQTYIADCMHFKYLNVFENKKANFPIRISDRDTYFNDIKKWKISEKKAIHIPIQNSSGILPNFQGNPWSKIDLQYIFKNHEVDRISKETYKTLSELTVKKDITIIFSMSSPNRKIQFACKIIFCSRQEKLLFDKIDSELIEIKNIRINHHEFKYLCESIGNNANLSDNKIGIVGVGSLGSYVAEEIINAGASNVAIFDGDNFENTNLLRHRLSSLDIGNSKIVSMQRKLNEKHPQVKVDCFEGFLTKDNIAEKIRENGIGCLIITVGSTDVQIELERKLNQIDEDIIVVYVWLELDGVNSKVLVTKNSNKACFSKYVSLEPDIRKKTDFTLFDGCGGARVKYGNKTLLTATNALLHALENINDFPIPFIVLANTTEGLKMSKVGSQIESIKIELQESHENF